MIPRRKSIATTEFKCKQCPEVLFSQMWLEKHIEKEHGKLLQNERRPPTPMCTPKQARRSIISKCFSESKCEVKHSSVPKLKLPSYGVKRLNMEKIEDDMDQDLDDEIGDDQTE